MRLELHHEHPWDVSPSEAVRLQKRLAALVREEPLPGPVETVAGVDMSVRGDRVRAAVAVLRLPELVLVDQAVWDGPVRFPYVPGLLSFREVPAVLEALARLGEQPDLLMADAQGRAHPRRFGLACHLGVLLDRPVIGVAKTRLAGTHDPPGPEKGDHTPLRIRDEIVGAVVRTRARVNPVYVSAGHRITLEEAVRWTLACTTRYRIPEPTRQAHRLSQ